MLIQAGGRPLQYEQEPAPSKTYTLLPDRFIEDAEVLRRWLARSVEHVSLLQRRSREDSEMSCACATAFCLKLLLV